MGLLRMLAEALIQRNPHWAAAGVTIESIMSSWVAHFSELASGQHLVTGMSNASTKAKNPKTSPVAANGVDPLTAYPVRGQFHGTDGKTIGNFFIPINPNQCAWRTTRGKDKGKPCTSDHQPNFAFCKMHSTKATAINMWTKVGGWQGYSQQLNAALQAGQPSSGMAPPGVPGMAPPGVPGMAPPGVPGMAPPGVAPPRYPGNRANGKVSAVPYPIKPDGSPGKLFRLVGDGVLTNMVLAPNKNVLGVDKYTNNIIHPLDQQQRQAATSAGIQVDDRIAQQMVPHGGLNVVHLDDKWIEAYKTNANALPASLNGGKEPEAYPGVPVPAAAQSMPSQAAAPVPVAAQSMPSQAAAPVPVAAQSMPSQAAVPIPAAAQSMPSQAAVPIPAAEQSMPSQAAAPVPVAEQSMSSQAAAPIPAAEQSMPSQAAAPIPAAQSMPSQAAAPVPAAQSMPSQAAAPVPAAQSMPSQATAPVPDAVPVVPTAVPVVPGGQALPAVPTVEETSG